MKLVWSELDSGRTSLKLQPSRQAEVSVFPRELLVDARLDSRLSDRVWVAAALAFDDRISGAWDGDFAVSAGCADEIRAFLGESSSFYPRLSNQAAPTFAVGATIRLVTDLEWSDPDHEAAPNEISLDLRRLGTWVGRIFSVDRYLVATNAYLLADASAMPQNYGPYLSVAVLLSQELAADRIVLPTGARAWQRLESATKLCAVVGINLVVEDVARPAAINAPAKDGMNV